MVEELRDSRNDSDCTEEEAVSPGGTHDETHDAVDLRDYGIPAVKRTVNTIKRTGKTIDGKRMGTHNGYSGKI